MSEDRGGRAGGGFGRGIGRGGYGGSHRGGSWQTGQGFSGRGRIHMSGVYPQRPGERPTSPPVDFGGRGRGHLSGVNPQRAGERPSSPPIEGATGNGLFNRAPAQQAIGHPMEDMAPRRTPITSAAEAAQFPAGAPTGPRITGKPSKPLMAAMKKVQTARSAYNLLERERRVAVREEDGAMQQIRDQIAGAKIRLIEAGESSEGAQLGADMAYGDRLAEVLARKAASAEAHTVALRNAQRNIDEAEEEEAAVRETWQHEPERQYFRCLRKWKNGDFTDEQKLVRRYRAEAQERYRALLWGREGEPGLVATEARSAFEAAYEQCKPNSTLEERREASLIYWGERLRYLNKEAYGLYTADELAAKPLMPENVRDARRERGIPSNNEEEDGSVMR